MVAFHVLLVMNVNNADLAILLIQPVNYAKKFVVMERDLLYNVMTIIIVQMMGVLLIVKLKSDTIVLEARQTVKISVQQPSQKR